MTYNFVIVKPQTYPYFKEVIEVLKGGLEDLGHEVLIDQPHTDPGYKNIILGAHLVDASFFTSSPEDTIILQTEPLMVDEVGRFAWNKKVKSLASRFEFWDYSKENIPILKGAGAINAKFLPLGYHKSIARIPKLKEQDIDILFYGAKTVRRNVILQRLPKNTKAVFMIFGNERDNLIARSKIVINIHSSNKCASFEAVRVSYLLANGKAVVSEESEDTIYDGGYKSVPYSNIVQTCEELLANPSELSKLEKKAISTIKKYPQKDLLKPLLD